MVAPFCSSTYRWVEVVCTVECLTLGSLPPNGGIRHHHVEPVFFLNVGEVFGEGVGVDDIGRLDAVQYHVHDGDDVGEGLLFLAVERALLKRLYVLRRKTRLRSKVLKRFAKESRRADRAVVYLFANLGLHDLDNGADERARGVILAAVAPGVAHVLDLGFVQVRELVLLGLGPEAQFVNVVDDLAQVVAALDLVLDLAEYLPDLVLDGFRAARLLLEVASQSADPGGDRNQDRPLRSPVSSLRGKAHWQHSTRIFGSHVVLDECRSGE
jgi:hypothetical protein